VRAILDPGARGAYNVAAGPPLDAATVATAYGLDTVRVDPRLARAAMGLAWRLRLQPSPPGWLDLALGVPLMSTARIERELGWTPRHSSLTALEGLLGGIHRTELPATPPLPLSLPVSAGRGAA
jgi:nucleoside-diphosphate-sugar epimerase